MSDTKKGDIVTPNSADQIGAILFACNINAVRSAMAETMVKDAFPGKIFVDSCGVTPGIQDGFATAVMQEIGLDMSAHQPKSFDDLDSGFYDVIISFSPEAHAAAEALTQNMDCATFLLAGR
jgi:protein-tyrosine-phosphatase